MWTVQPGHFWSHQPLSGDNKWRKRGKAFRREGIAFAIPMVLVTFPVAAGVLGKILADWLEKPWIVAVAVLVGLAAGLRECVRLVKLLNRENNE